MDRTEWLTAEELATWMVLIELIAKLPPLLDSQLERDSGVSHFEYSILAGLSEAPQQTLQMTYLADFAKGSLSRLSHAVKRLEDRGWVSRAPCPQDGRLTHATITQAGLDKIVAAAPAHVAEARRLVIDILTPRQLQQFRTLGQAILRNLDASS